MSISPHIDQFAKEKGEHRADGRRSREIAEALSAEHSDADIFAVCNLAARRRRAKVSAPKECAGKATCPLRIS